MKEQSREMHKEKSHFLGNGDETKSFTNGAANTTRMFAEWMAMEARKQSTHKVTQPQPASSFPLSWPFRLLTALA